MLVDVPPVEMFGFRLCSCRLVLLGFCLWTSLVIGALLFLFPVH
jgi:hypothetical protein